MYQKEMKEGFCESYLRSRIIQKTSLYGLFRKIEPYENRLQKDASLFTKDEAIKMYIELKSRSVYTLMNNNTVLKAYYLWRKHYYGVDVESAYENISIDDLRPCVDKNASKILSREDITEIEDQLLNVTDAAIVELLFNGVAGKSMEDLYAVSEECVKGDTLVVNGKIFPMTDRLKELLPKAFAETEVMSYGETMKILPVTGKGRIYKERCNARGVDTPDSRFRFFYRKIQMFRDYLDMPVLTMKNISTSGLWYYLQCGMNETGLDLRSFLRTENGKEIATRYGFSKDYCVDNIYAKYEQYL
jgi:hypothetical protein